MRKDSDSVQAVKAAGPNSSQLAIEGTVDEVTGASYVETDASHWHSGMRSHNLQSPLAKVIHQLTGTERVVFYSDQLFYKGAGSRVKTPWHQDKPYFLVDGGDVAVALIGPGVDASHNYERTHVDALIGTTKWIMAYLLN